MIKEKELQEIEKTQRDILAVYPAIRVPNATMDIVEHTIPALIAEVRRLRKVIATKRDCGECEYGCAWFGEGCLVTHSKEGNDE